MSSTSDQTNSLDHFSLSSNFTDTSIPPNQQSARFPLWAQEHYIPIFNPVLAVASATNMPTTSATTSSSLSPPSAEPSHPLPEPTSSSSSMSQPSPTALSSSLKGTSSNAGAIAGGVIGAVLFISLIIIIILYYRRWRNEHRVAPSAEFMSLAGPRARYTRAPDGSSPPAFMERDGSDPVLEKAYYSAQAQMRLDSNHSSGFAWER
ncbi:hypothetical protein Clacol_006252 [Clathrus columnatus]|uniref:Uncharacterized protein n=1 Tax=Clathrus columnatus TaxID=1419009 RepID=A0AAV5ABL7_9AGAM|nr:hypothetical protein Clacol_006252 [Clathrus columnatus]